MRPVEQDATLRIQCVFRGWAVRSRVAAKHSCALRIQTIMRMKLAGLRARRMHAAKVGSLLLLWWWWWWRWWLWLW